MIRLSRSQLAVSVLEIGVRAPQLDDERAAHAPCPPLTLATLWHFSERKSTASSTASPRARACITGSPPLHDELAAEHLSRVGQKDTHGEARAHIAVAGRKDATSKTPPPGTYRCSSMQRTLSGRRRADVGGMHRTQHVHPRPSHRASRPRRKHFFPPKSTCSQTVQRHRGEPGHTQDIGKKTPPGGAGTHTGHTAHVGIAWAMGHRYPDSRVLESIGKSIESSQVKSSQMCQIGRIFPCIVSVVRRSILC